MKRIILCFDGTWNTPADESIPEDKRVETNVRRFYQSIADVDSSGVEQAPWYNEGVGTAVLNKTVGGAFGLGLDHHILSGYTRLVETYEEGDEIYIVGFSRGAYTARSLVGMIRNCGLVRHGATASLQTGIAYGIYRTRDDGPDSTAAEAFRAMFSREVPIKFLGVWDTVGSLGLPTEATARLGAAGKLNTSLFKFHDTGLSAIVKRAYHAIALDEHRASYDVTLWDPKEKPGQTLEQRWFCGAHSDVGGGYKDRRLSDLTLNWMQLRAAEAGLALTPLAVGSANVSGESTDSYAGFLNGLYARHNPRHLRVVLGTRFGNEVIDSSVNERRRSPGLAYRPANVGLPALTG